MPSPVLHIKDAYYFDVPKFMWQHHYTSLDQVPQYLVDAHPDTPVAYFNKALAGKILIPQPFGQLRNLYQPASGLCISRNMVLEFAVAVILCVVLIGYARHVRNGQRPRGMFWNFVEMLVVFVRDQVARPAIGHDADRYMPLLWSIFFFVLGMNLMGLVPWTGAPTASFGVTLALAGVTFVTVLYSGMAKFGPIGFWIHQCPQMDLPWYYAPIKFMVWAIEVMGLFVKHGVLAVRLLANMLAGHLVLLSILGMAFTAKVAAHKFGLAAVVVSVAAGSVFDVLELFVAFLQAYIFVFLSALFIGSATHGH